MEIPSANDPKWKKIILGELNYEFEYLAVKIILGRLHNKYQIQQTDEVMRQSIDELRVFFEKNKSIPKVHNDLLKIFNSGVK